MMMSDRKDIPVRSHFTKWRDISRVERGALLLAEHDGVGVEVLVYEWGQYNWKKKEKGPFHDGMVYRRQIDPEDIGWATIILPISSGYINKDGGDISIKFATINDRIATGVFVREDGITMEVQEVKADG